MYVLLLWFHIGFNVFSLGSMTYIKMNVYNNHFWDLQIREDFKLSKTISMELEENKNKRFEMTSCIIRSE